MTNRPEQSGRHENEAETLREKVKQIMQSGEQARDNIAASAEQQAEQVEAQAHHAAERVRETARTARDIDRDKVRETADEVRDRAREQAEEIGRRVVDRGDAAMSSGGERLHQASRDLRERSREGPAAKVAQVAADMLDQSGDYLLRSTPEDARRDLDRTVHTHPFRFIAVGFVVGFFSAMLLRARKRRRR
jgi:ElaB/YqjD/DUF883 family membrane-anchored ribosome-binding protein